MKSPTSKFLSGFFYVIMFSNTNKICILACFLIVRKTKCKCTLQIFENKNFNLR